MIPKWVSSVVDGIRSILMIPIVALIDMLKGLLRIPAVWIDGTLYVSIAVLGVLSTSFATEEAAKFVSPEALFWTKMTLGALSQACLALKMFRSNPHPPSTSTATSAPTAPPSNPDQSGGVTQFFGNPNTPQKDQ